MRIVKFSAQLALTCGVMLLSACAPSTEADEAAIRAANKHWMEAIAAKDAKAVAAIYAEDGQMLAPNAPKAVGREQVEKAWSAFLGAPGLTLTFETEKFAFAKSADLAVDIGTYKLAMGGTTDVGKSVVTWVKRKGQWLVLTDMFSSDAPQAAPPAPAAAAPAPSPTDAAPAEPVTPPAGAPAPTTPPVH